MTYIRFKAMGLLLTQPSTNSEKPLFHAVQECWDCRQELPHFSLGQSGSKRGFRQGVHRQKRRNLAGLQKMNVPTDLDVVWLSKSRRSSISTISLSRTTSFIKKLTTTDESFKPVHLGPLQLWTASEVAHMIRKRQSGDRQDNSAFSNLRHLLE